MADQVLSDHPPNPNFSCRERNFDSFQIPLDTIFLDENLNFVDNFPFDDAENYDFDFSFDEIDELYLPAENESCLVHIDSTLDLGHSRTYPNRTRPDLLDDNLHDLTGDRECVGSGINCDKSLNCSPSQAGRCDAFDRSSDSVRVWNLNSPIESLQSGFSGTVNTSSPDSGNFVVDQQVKVEGDVAKTVAPKRKIDTSDESRNHKLRRSEKKNEKDTISTSTTNLQCGNDGTCVGGEGLTEAEEKRMARLMRNRESAQLSRQRKKQHVEQLEEKVRAMHSTIAELNGKISYFMTENASLRQQLSSSGNGACAHPIYPMMGAVAYPWMMPFLPYVVKPQGSQVPLVPIPKLKQQHVPVVKDKTSQHKKTYVRTKTKKVASLSLLGFLFFIFLFARMMAIANIKFGGLRETKASSSSGLGAFTERCNDQQRERVWTGNGHTNSSAEGKERINGSEPLLVSLYVPRNDKLVKIDGNLIIRSVLASERATALHGVFKSSNYEDTALAIPEIGSNGRKHSHLSYGAYEQLRALTAGSADSLKEHFRLCAANGKTQQWFHEGIAEPLLRSGMCSEVFQFDLSSAPGAIVPAASIANTTAEKRQNTTRNNKGKNRRTLQDIAATLFVSDLNLTAEHIGKFPNDNFQVNKSVSPVVVSVLVDPREAGNGGIDGMITPKLLSRIFVVVLIDSVKYVTYSCGLPHIPIL